MKNIIFKLIIIIIKPILAFFIGTIFIYLLSIILFSFLIGFEKPSQLCNKVKENKLTRLDMILFPTAKYGCKDNAGIFQPYVNNLGKWLISIPENN